MKKLIWFAAAALLLAACPKDSKDPGELSGVHPDQIFLGRSMQVVVAADGLNFSEESIVDFGNGVVVNATELLGSGTLLVSVTVDPLATPGTRSISVDNNILKDAVELTSPLAMELTSGTEQLGGFNMYTIYNLDPMTPFGNPDDALIELGPGTEILFYDVFASDEAEILVYFDPFAAAGPISLTITEGDVVSHLAEAFNPTANPLTTIDTATPWDADLSMPGAVALAQLDLSAGDVVDIDITAQDIPLLLVFDTVSGTIADAKVISFVQGRITLGADKSASYVLSLHDASLFGAGPAGQSNTTFIGRTATVTQEAEGNDDTGTANLLANLPALMASGIGVQGDVDFYAIDLTAFADNAALVSAVTMPAIDTPLTFGDTYIVAHEDTDIIADNEDIDPSGYYYSALSTPLIGANAYIEISSSPIFAPDDMGNYLAGIFVTEGRLLGDSDPANDDMATADTVVAGEEPDVFPTIVDAAVSALGDQDWYKFQVTADSVVTIQTGAAGSGTLGFMDTALTLDDCAGNILDQNEDIDPFGNYFSAITFNATAGTDYCVMAESSPVFAPDDTGDYRLSISVR